MLPSKQRVWDKLVEIGPDEARARLNGGLFKKSDHDLVRDFLRQYEERIASAAALKDETFQEEGLALAQQANSLSREANSISRDANSIADLARIEARKANRLAIIAVTISTIVVAKEIIEWFSR